MLKPFMEIQITIGFNECLMNIYNGDYICIKYERGVKSVCEKFHEIKYTWNFSYIVNPV